MYDELVKRLREHNGWALNETLDQAADAIEELSKRETPMKITEIHVDEYYCPACGAENNCDEGYVQDDYCPVCGQRILPGRQRRHEHGSLYQGHRDTKKLCRLHT